MEELILRDVNQLEEISAKSVPVLLEEAPGVVEDHSCEVVDPEGGEADIGICGFVGTESSIVNASRFVFFGVDVSRSSRV